MQTPTRDSEPSDYQELYRKHVHQNMLLHEHLKQMDTVEKSKLRQLQNETTTFKNKYLKYLGNEKSSHNSDCKTGDEKQCKHRSSYLVCKDFAYTSQTWHDLVDVTKPRLDIYKTEILTNTVGERPEREPTTKTNGSIPVYGQYKSQLEKRDSLPVIGVSGEKTSSKSPPVIVVSSDVVKRVKSEGSRLNLLNLDGGSPDRDGCLASRSLNLTSLSLQEDASDDFCTDRPQPHRRRSHTISTTQTPPALLSRRRSSIRSRSSSFTGNVSGIGKGWQMIQKKAKLISASLSLLHDAREVENKKTAKSFEDLRHCRYLRLADDESNKSGLDNMTFSREKLNCEELYNTDTSTNQLIVPSTAR